MISKTKLKDIVFSIPFLKKIYTNKRAKSGGLISLDRIDEVLNEAEVVLLKQTLTKKINIGLVKDGDEYEGYVKTRSYYPKYERFLKNNKIDYAYYDILKHDWIEEAKKFDFIIWHTDSDPMTQEIATNKIYILEKKLGIRCLPSFDEIWTYEDKINMHYLYSTHNLPEIPTFVTHSKKDALEYVSKIDFPIISKLVTGSSSFGVKKIENLQSAKRIIDEAFCYKGLKTYFPYQRQKDYVLFQEFVKEATFDLRVMVVGDKLLGYYRYPNKGDFKASGAGNVEKKAIDFLVLDLAYKVKEKFNCTFLATDFLYSKADDCYYIIESSIFIGVDTPSQLEVDGVSGYYQRIDEGKYDFVEGKYWIQELVLKELL